MFVLIPLAPKSLRGDTKGPHMLPAHMLRCVTGKESWGCGTYFISSGNQPCSLSPWERCHISTLLTANTLLGNGLEADWSWSCVLHIFIKMSGSRKDAWRRASTIHSWLTSFWPFEEWRMIIPICQTLNNRSWDQICSIHCVQHLLMTLSLGVQAEEWGQTAVVTSNAAHNVSDSGNCTPRSYLRRLGSHLRLNCMIAYTAHRQVRTNLLIFGVAASN